MGRIFNWDGGETFCVFIGDEKLESITDCFGGKNPCRFSDDGQISLMVDGVEAAYSCHLNDLECYHTGDIISIGSNGIFNKAYDSETREIDVFITSHCNSNCIMCPLSEVERKRHKEKYIDWLKRYIQILPEDIGFINITGGEPTLAKEDFLEILGLLRDKFVYSDFQMLTNGRSMADGHFLERIMEKCPKGIRFAIPIHSSNPALHDAITRADGSFFQTDRGIKNLLKLHQKVEVRVVVSKRNMESLDETSAYIVENHPGVFCVNFIGMEMMGNAAVNRDDLWVDYSDAFMASKKGIDWLAKNGIDVALYNFPLCAISRGYWHIAAKSITDYKIRYMDECEECTVKDICGGFFQSTKQIMKPSVNPIRKSDEA